MNFVSFVTLTEKEIKKFDPKKDFFNFYDKEKGKVANMTSKYQDIFKGNNFTE